MTKSGRQKLGRPKFRTVSEACKKRQRLITGFSAVGAVKDETANETDKELKRLLLLLLLLQLLILLPPLLVRVLGGGGGAGGTV